tara:strand:+ start:1248 stop:1499 length:252 start_codon:yes stop_codon:yes gene_type:complete
MDATPEQFLKINEGRRMVMAKKINDNGEVYTTDDLLALDSYTFLKKKSVTHYEFFHVDPINLGIKSIEVNAAVLSEEVKAYFK